MQERTWRLYRWEHDPAPTEVSTVEEAVELMRPYAEAYEVEDQLRGWVEDGFVRLWPAYLIEVTPIR